MERPDLIRRLIAACALALVAGAGFAQSNAAASKAGLPPGYPDKPLHLIIPFGAGGGNDIVARIVAQKLGEAWGQTVLVENKPGASGIIALEYVRKAAPDGYTILMGPSGPMTCNPAIYATLPYSTLRDFIPVAMIGSFPLILVVNGSLPVKSVAELVAYGKEHPKKANYGSTSALFQLTAELFNQKTGSAFQHIPYKSSAAFVDAVLSNEIMIAFADPPPSAGHIRAGRLRALAVTSAARNARLPTVPTFAQAGVPGMSFSPWMGIFLPAGTPAAIADGLHNEIVRIDFLPDVSKRFDSLGVDASKMSREEFAKAVADDIARWTQVAKTAHITAQY